LNYGRRKAHSNLGQAEMERGKVSGKSGDNSALENNVVERGKGFKPSAREEKLRKFHQRGYR